MSVAARRCRLCGRTGGTLKADPSLGAARVRTVRGRRVRDTRQTYYHGDCLLAETGHDEMPYPATAADVEDARQYRKAAAGY